MTLPRGPYTCLYREIWNDEKFWRRSELGQRIYFYIISTPLGNGLGCFRAGLAAMAEDLRMTVKRFREGFDEGFAESFGEPLYLYDECHKVVFIPKYFIRNPPNNPNGIKSLGKAFVQIPDCDLKVQCYRMVKSFIEPKGESFTESFEESFREPLGERTGTISPSYSLPLPLSATLSATKAQTATTSARGRDEFAIFYAAYPKKEDRADAERAWKSTFRKRPPLDVILAAIEAQKKGDKWTRGYIKAPASWLRKGAWDDVVEPVRIPESDWERKQRLDREAWDARTAELVAEEAAEAERAAHGND